MANKLTDSQIQSRIKYTKEKMVRVLLDINKSTMQDVLGALESVPSKQGYIVSLIRSDCYRRFSNHLVLHGKDLDYITVSKYASEIEAVFDRFKALSNPEALARVQSQFVENTPAHVIVSEYLRSTDTDPIIIE